MGEIQETQRRAWEIAAILGVIFAAQVLAAALDVMTGRKWGLDAFAVLLMLVMIFLGYRLWLSRRQR